jgi:hypothetical protein
MNQETESCMLDILMVVITVAFFALSFALIRWLERI